ncbi:lysine-specific histone demethylase 2-like isoform X2 [Watersipora subatra]|uniref:lysine-specific histone demethylase 2-like isoform X2 n=1 Tax=Watersipora subatra TaxID=2589382 RepID=UPI00355BF7EE
MASAQKKAKREKSVGESKSDSSLSKSEDKDTRSLCERVDCPTDELTCVLEVCDQCINREEQPDRSNHPWTHLSLGEHVCNICVEFYTKSQNVGYGDYYKWKKVWTANARSEPTIATFIGDQVLPYWIQCIRCSKWREMGRYFALNKDLTQQFICTSSCDEVEDKRVEAAKQPYWINTLLYPPYLTQSPAEVYLKAYYPDAVGMSATEKTTAEHCGDYFSRPFHESPSSCYALSVRPDVMDFDETVEFGEFACAQQMYLCLRNLVVAYWAKNNSEWLTLDKCRHIVICRGLVRVRCLIDLERIITFLTMKSVINVGLLPHPPPAVFSRKVRCETVVIIGAGTAGLAAAQHLYKHGIQVAVLEAKDRLGGRVHVTRLSNGSLLTLGPDIISGSINNPIALMARQSKLVVQEFPLSNLTVLGKQNKAVSADSLRKAENRYLEILDLMYEWAHGPTPPLDVSFKAKAKEINEKLNEEDEEDRLSPEEEQLLGVHFQTLSVTLGTNLSDLSARFWNAHEEYPQFGGPSFILKQGIGAVLTKMAAGFAVEYNKQVERIHYETDVINIWCSDGTSYSCKKVIVTPSAAVIRSNLIQFYPPLPDKKQKALNSIKFGKLEKVVMHFKKKFWSPKMHGARIFTSLSILSDPECPGHLIYDMSSNTGHVLTIYVADEKLAKYTSLNHAEREAALSDACLEMVRKIFPNAPGPMTTSVSSWMNDRHIGLSRVYLPVGVDNQCYDHIQEPINNKIYFAGEACIRSHCNIVTGAYLSGVQQAVAVLETGQSPAAHHNISSTG